MENKYPEYIMQKVSENLELEYDEINQLSANEVFDALCNYEGLINYGETIRRWISDIYGIEL